ncbi:HD domain-containing protein [Lineolata rhizophorae]|uniref:HD domain-containing protein n=1 Tax=Lineolata rhizophorae TaxID=578093 RepID=A0A6A6NRN5_9PEZI|nr:HD domain-containing protein [Lineolata rhizophorae]
MALVDEDLSSSGAAVYEALQEHVRESMSRYDASHDFNHIHRVVALARRILAGERARAAYDTDVVLLAALLHDVSDKKYAPAGQENRDEIADLLRKHGAPDALAVKVQTIALNVSYSKEIKDPARTAAILGQHPELAIVQDADRLDALGAIGVGRALTFAAARGPPGGMGEAIQHFGDKLEHLGDMMKTETGRQMARTRTERLKTFRTWWVEEETLVV